MTTLNTALNTYWEDDSMTRLEIILLLTALNELHKSGNYEGAMRVIEEGLREAQNKKD